MDLDSIYSPAFFEQHRKWLSAYRVLAGLIREFVADTARSSIVDVGCGHGFLVEHLRAEGFTDAYGLEGSRGAQEMWPAETRGYYRIADLTDESARDAMPVTELVCSFETGEHLLPEKACHYVGTLTAHRPSLVFFSAATPFQDLGRSAVHVNEQSFGYWIERFEQADYRLDVPSTVHCRNSMLDAWSAFVDAWWYPKNFLLFRRRDIPHGGTGHIRLFADDVLTGPIRWFAPIPDLPALDGVFERDKSEYLELIERYLTSGGRSGARGPLTLP